MTDYVRDNTSLPSGKVDRTALSVPANQAVTAAEWNAHCAATDSVRAWLLGGDYHGLASAPTAPAAPAGVIHTRNNAGVWEVSKPGHAYRPVESVLDVRDYGAVGDGVTDDTAAFLAAVAACPVGGVVYVPRGTWRMTSTLTLTEGITLQGDHPQYYGDATTVLTWPAGVNGLVLGPGAGGRVGLCRVENLCVWATGKSTGAVGIRPLAKCFISGLYLSGWKTNGIRLVGTTEAPYAYANVNGSYIGHSAIEGSDGDGMYLTGSDCNAFLVAFVSSRSNGGYGIRDTTLTSGTYLQCHVEENVGGGYYCTNSGAGAMFVGCYAEGGQAHHIAPPAQIIGGTGMDGQNYTHVGAVAARASTAGGLTLGGGGGQSGSLVHTPILGGATGTWTLDITCEFCFPYISVNSTLSAVPAFSGLTYGQQFTLQNNTAYSFTIPDHSLAGNGVHLPGGREMVLRGGDAVTFIALGPSVVTPLSAILGRERLPDPSSLGTNTVPVADGSGNWATRAVTAVSDPTYGENGAVPYIQDGTWARGNVSRYDIALAATTFDLATSGDWAHAQVTVHAEADIAAVDWPSGAVVSAGTHVGDRRVVVVTGAHTISLPSESMHADSGLVLESTAVDLTPGSILELEWFSGAWHEVRRRLVSV